MQIITNRFGPDHPRYNTLGDLAKLVDHAASEYEFLFWNQTEMDFFTGYCLIKGRSFKHVCLWADRWAGSKQASPARLFIRIPGLHRVKLP